jgi:hypothetical protein
MEIDHGYPAPMPKQGVRAVCAVAVRPVAYSDLVLPVSIESLRREIGWTQ